REKGRWPYEAQVSADRGCPPTLPVGEQAAVATPLVAQMSGGGARTERRVSAVRWRTRLVTGLAVTAVLAGCATSRQSDDLPLRQVSETALSGGPVRFDYTALDSERGRLFIAHMGASQLIEVDVHAHAMVRTLPDLSDV